MPLDFLYVQSDVPVGFYLKDILASCQMLLIIWQYPPSQLAFDTTVEKSEAICLFFFFSFVIDLVIYMTAHIVLPLVNPETSLG